ncbi:MAG: CPBP family glutamic-type intramembrane protease [Bacteroidales bacterium]|jgi:membrane protease YdiL (CAAX protease family)
MFEPSEFFHFLQRPQYQFFERKKAQVLGTAIKIYLLSLLFIGLVSLINTTILRAFLTLPIDETLSVPDKFKEHLWAYFLLVVIFSPITEEIIFRLSLIFDPIYLSLSFSTLLALIVHKVSNGIISIVSFLLLFFLIYRLAFIHKRWFLFFWERNFKYIFYLLSFLFGIVHITNYNCTELYQYLITLFLIFPQLAIGIILSFTRIYYEKGFLICIIIHVLMNLISVSIFLLQYSH